MKTRRHPLDRLLHVALGLVLLLGLAACRSKVIVLDQRPAWVVDAEQRLKRDPVFSLDDSSDRDTRPLWASQPSDNPPARQEASTARSRPSSQTTNSTTTRPNASRPVPVQPPGIFWGETKISVEVGD
ncbi:MAG: hypothetical protein ACNA77_03405 [Opitutales bacterium]